MTGDGEKKVARYISLTHLTTRELRYVQQQIAAANSLYQQIGWEKYWSGCRFAIYYAYKSAYPGAEDSASLYSARHLYGAELKRVGVDTKLGGQLMGQRSGKVYKRVYGGRVRRSPNTISTQYLDQLQLALDFLESDN